MIKNLIKLRIQYHRSQAKHYGNKRMFGVSKTDKNKLYNELKENWHEFCVQFLLIFIRKKG